jgi:protein involved in polysaccharide export with SLBB domain
MIHRSSWLIGVGFLAIAMAGDDPRQGDETPPTSPAASAARPESPFKLESDEADGLMPDDDVSDTRQEVMEPDEELVESGEISPALLRKIDARMAEVAREIKPVSFTIPDDPPPHEGKLIDIPYLIDAPDLIQVEILEALPGRPISGERLVRPDGTICLEFYGDVYVRGLTPQQAKTRIVLHMRKYLTDEMLGLVDEFPEFDIEAAVPPHTTLEPYLPLPRRGDVIMEPGPEPEDDVQIDFEKLTPEQRDAIRDLLRTREQKKTRPSSSSSKTSRRTIHRVAQETPSAPRPAPVIVVPTEKGNIRVTIEVEGNLENSQPSTRPDSPHQVQGEDKWGEGSMRIIHPSDSDRVFVDVTAYNHDVYFVQGDVTASGRLPFTGNETVLDALNYAGGLADTADPANIRLVRPARGDTPAKVYRINYDAIVNEGDARSNLQLFPGDRIVVGRHPTVKSTVALDRALSFVNDATNTMLTSAMMAKQLRTAMQDAQLTPDQVRERVNAWVDMAWPLIEKGEAGVVDEKSFRDFLLESIVPDSKPQAEAPK